MDSAWWRAYRDEVRRTFAGALTTIASGVQGVEQVRFQYSLNSGACAIGLAAHWGAKRVILVGYDAQRTGGKSHWHGDHPHGLGNAGSMGQWKGHFERVAHDLADVEIVNCSRETALRMFRRAALDEALGVSNPPRLPAILLAGMHGLGDNLYQRSVLREVVKSRDVYLETPWPQLYADLPVRCVRPATRLRTQTKNAARADLVWHAPPAGVKSMRWHYVGAPGSILEALARPLGIVPRVFDGPPVATLSREPYIVVRPSTLRREWRADSRNPQQGLIDRAAQALRSRFRIVSVADLQDGEEWPAEPLPYADERYHAGELSVEQLLGLVAGAAGVVGGVGWMVPAAIAYRVPMLLILGGCGAHHGPGRIFGPPMDTSNVQIARPDRFCMCADKAHACDKRISNFDAHVDAFGLRLAQGRSVAVAA